MSKAFTRESDDAVEEPVLARQVSLLPPGVKNYITPDGARRLREELDQLTQVERPPLVDLLADETLADSAAVSDARRRLQMLDQRVLVLDQSLQTAEIVAPPPAPGDVVHFGSTVLVRDKSGEATEYRIVGIDETDLDRNWVSWRSPIARALLNARVGQTVRFRFPGGEKELEIVDVTYQ